MGQRELGQENDRLRERVLDLENQLLRKTRESAEARARLQRTDHVHARPENLMAYRPLPARHAG